MKKTNVYIVSDAVGETAEIFAKSALIQFIHSDFQIKRKSFIDDLAKVDEVIDEAVEEDALIVYTLIQPEMRAYLQLRANENGLFTYDVFGNFIEVLEQKLQTAPMNVPGLSHRLDAEYFQKIEAIEFAVKYDDGKDPKGIEEADIVLIGVSRTSKTPVSQYLAYRGIKVANVPIVPEVKPPRQLFQIDRRKCIGLVTTVEKLNEVRKERLKALGLGDSAMYANEERIQKELDFFHQFVDQLHCPVVDVSNKAIEETANRVLQVMKRHEQV